MKLLSYNIQAGIGCKHYRDYFTSLHRQFFNSKKKAKTLDQIGKYIKPYDVICLQEIDLGGRRSGFASQYTKLMEISGHQFGVVQLNRSVGMTSHHGNAILSRHPISLIEDHKLPGRVGGRGMLVCECADFTIVNTHLSIGREAQRLQFNYMRSVLKDRENIVLMGDLNCHSEASQLVEFAEQAGLHLLTNPATKSFPSWKPKRDLDHVLVSQNLSQGLIGVKDVRYSDHRPIELTIR